MTLPRRTLRKIIDRAPESREHLEQLAEAVTLTRKEARALRARQRKATAAARAGRRKWYEEKGLFD